MKIKIIYEDKDVLVVNKPAGIVVFPEGKTTEKTLIDYLLENFPYLKDVGNPPRYGIVHRLDRDTSGILLLAKNKRALKFLQGQFKKRKVIKKYLVLVVGRLEKNEGIIKTLIGRSPKGKKQKVYFPYEPDSQRRREAITKYKVIKRFKNYTLVEAEPKTGRRHQIRVHFAFLKNPVAGDKLYGFKNQPLPKNLTRQFLHASFLKIKMPDGKTKEFNSLLPNDLKKVIKDL